MLYQTYIFDLDGTITNSERGIIECAIYALKKMGREIPSKEILKRFLGPPLVKSFMEWCHMTQEDATEATMYYRERYIPIGAYENSVYHGMRSLLKALKKNKAYLGVATGKPEKTSIEILKYFNLYQYFDIVKGPMDDEFNIDKETLIERTNLPMQNAVMIGDTAGDIDGANKTNIHSVYATYGYGRDEEGMALCPTHVAHSVTDLQKLFLGAEIKEKGVFISVEGLDGCGKTTQMNAAKIALEDFGFDVHTTREPGGCPVAEEIRKILLAKKDNGMTDLTEAMLFASARAQHVKEVILTKMEEGKTVLCDRYLDSSLAYQGAGRMLGIQTVQQVNQKAIENCMPDITIYLDIDRETSLKRRNNVGSLDRIEKQDDAFFDRVKSGYEQVIQEDTQRFLMVDAKQSIDQVSVALKEKLRERLIQKGVM